LSLGVRRADKSQTSERGEGEERFRQRHEGPFRGGGRGAKDGQGANTAGQIESQSSRSRAIVKREESDEIARIQRAPASDEGGRQSNF
jgi:hypothetical protein